MLKRLLLFITTIFLISCNRVTHRNSFVTPDKNDIAAIVKTIIIKDSLANHNIPLVAELIKIKVLAPKKNFFLPPPPGTPVISIQTFLKFTKTHLSKTDSLYLLFQNNVIKHFTLTTKIAGAIKLIDSAQRENSTNGRFFDISIPLFSSDRQKAFVEINHYCPLCGMGLAVYMAKVNGEWKIVYQSVTWQS